MKMPPQILRIILLAAAIVGSYLVARQLLTPPSFKQYGGFYRGAALGELASHEPVFAGKKACADCHDKEAATLQAGEHKGLSCEACHGANQAHVDDLNVKPEKLSFNHCARCHEKNVSRPKWHKQISTKEHYPGDKCTECHVPHNPKEVP